MCVCVCGCVCSIRIMAVNIYFVGADLGTSAKWSQGPAYMWGFKFQQQISAAITMFSGIGVLYRNKI